MPSPLIAFQFGYGSAELSGYCLQRRKFGLLTLRAKTIQDAPQDSVLGSFMDVWIETVEVAQAGLQPMRPLLEDEEAVRSLSSNGVGEPQLERHVEARDSQRTGHRNPAEIVDRCTAARDQAVNPVQTILASAGDFQHAAWRTSHCGEAR